VVLVAKSTITEWEEPDKLLLLEAWARDGITDEQIAGNMGINVRTLYNWKKKSVRIFQSLKTNKELADIEVENALRKKALGFRETEQTVSVRKTVEYENGKRVREVTEPIVVESERYYPPDTAAQIFWLKNRRPERWRDKQEQKVDLTEAVKIVDSIGDSD
jgi:transcriptional regulator with XRE-family HTH domain